MSDSQIDRETLFLMAEARRASLKAEIAIVAGSVGKTTVKEMLVCVLRQWAMAERGGSGPEAMERIGFNEGNLNTKIGIATHLLGLSSGCEKAVFEVGARRRGDFQIPLRLLQPKVVTLLNIGSAHAGEFGSLADLRAEKLSVLQARSAETLVVNGDDRGEGAGEDAASIARATGRKVITFGAREDNDWRAREFQGWLPVPGSALNFAAAAATASALGIAPEVVDRALRGFVGVERRFESRLVGQTVCIDDAFNASPESMIEGLRAVRGLHAGKHLILVLGAMLELGEVSAEAHVRVGRFVSEEFADEVKCRRLTLVTIGEEAKSIGTELAGRAAHFHFSSSSDARSFLDAEIVRHEVAYFKGSKSLRLDMLVPR